MPSQAIARRGAWQHYVEVGTAGRTPERAWGDSSDVPVTVTILCTVTPKGFLLQNALGVLISYTFLHIYLESPILLDQGLPTPSEKCRTCHILLVVMTYASSFWRQFSKAF